MGIQRVEDLIVWQKAMDLTAEVYKASHRLPRQEQYNLISQMQRAAASIPGNIAEGFKRHGSRDQARLFNIGRASAEELRTFLLLPERLGYVPTPPAVFALLDEVCAMLHRLWQMALSDERQIPPERCQPPILRVSAYRRAVYGVLCTPYSSTTS